MEQNDKEEFVVHEVTENQHPNYSDANYKTEPQMKRSKNNSFEFM